MFKANQPTGLGPNVKAIEEVLNASGSTAGISVNQGALNVYSVISMG
jgi:hypothetical protein